MKLTIVKGNIVHIHADAIVLPANPSLKEGPGASKAIFEAAGRKKLKAACEEKDHAKSEVRCQHRHIICMQTISFMQSYQNGLMENMTNIIFSVLHIRPL